MVLILNWWTEHVVEGLYRLSLTIDGAIYSLIEGAYKIFLLLANASLFSSDDLGDFVERIYTIIGVIMLFVLAYSLLTSLINPDELNKSKKSPMKIIGNLIITLVLLELVPIIFDYGYKLQSALLENNTIGKIIIGTDNTSTGVKPSDDIKNGGNLISTSIFSAFFHPTEDYCKTKTEEDTVSKNCEVLELGIEGAASITYGTLLYQVETGSSFYIFKEFTPSKIVNGDIEYTVLISQAAGIFALYLIVSFSFSLGLRLVKLSFFQLIAPLPILSRLMPNDSGSGVFSKWVKITLTAYFEVFIRIAVLFFSIYMISIVSRKFGSDVELLEMFGNSNVDYARSVIGLLLVFIIFGILSFAKQAPKLITDMLGLDSSSMSLKSPLSTMLGGLAGGIAGAATGFVGGGLASARQGVGFMAGARSGMANGWKARGNQFGKQKQAMYSKFGGKGKAGMFGAQALSDKWASSANKKAEAKANEKNQNKIDKFENSDMVNEAINASYAQKEADYTNEMSQRYGLTADELIDAENIGATELTNRINAASTADFEKELSYENNKIDTIRNSAEFKDKTKAYAAEMFRNSGQYDPNLSISEQRAKFNAFKNSSDVKEAVMRKYIAEGGKNADYLQDRLDKRDSLTRDIDTIRKNKQKMEAQRLYVLQNNEATRNEAKASMKTEAKEEVLQNFKNIKNPTDKDVKKYQEALTRERDMTKYKDESKANKELAKQLEKFFKDNNSKGN